MEIMIAKTQDKAAPGFVPGRRPGVEEDADPGPEAELLEEGRGGDVDSAGARGGHGGRRRHP